MKTNWPIEKFENCIESVKYTTKIPSKDYKEIGKFPIISQEEDLISGFWDDEADVYKIEKPIVIFGDHTKVIKYIDFDFVLGADGVKILQPKEFLDAKFFMYFLKNANIKSLGYARHYRLLKELNVPLPPLEEQKRIVAVLDKKFAQIETLKTAAEKNLQNTKQLFQAELSKTFNDKDLEKKKLSDLCELISGYAFDSKGYTSNDEDTLLICGDNIMHCSFRWETIKRWPKEQYEELKRFELKESDIVLAMDRPWIKSGLKISKITDNELPSLLVQRTAAIRTSSKVLSEYLYYALQEESFSKYLVDQQTGVGVPHISGKQILNYEVGIPISTDIRSEDSNLCNIVSHLDSLSEKVHQLEEIYTKQLADCDELKQSLLQKAFNSDL